MSVVLFAFLFLGGLAIGSFLNVVAMRYDGEHFLFSPKLIGGRSHCPHCKNTLRWFELLPLLSYVAQRGRCRHCKARISIRYPIMELVSGLIFVLIPLRFVSAIVSPSSTGFIGLSIIWIIAFEIFFLLTYIDIRLGIIPDELNIALFLLGIVEVWFLASTFGIGNPSFFGAYATIFGLQGNVWINHIVGALFGGLFFGGLVAATRGKGMGMGDVKLAVPLGMLFGWPDILGITMLSFIVGGAYGLFAITLGKKTMKSAVPFAPFLVAGLLIVFFGGSALLGGYFHVLGL